MLCIPYAGDLNHGWNERVAGGIDDTQRGNVRGCLDVVTVM